MAYKYKIKESLTAGFPFRKTSGEDFEKIEITEPMDDATKSRMIKNFKAAGWDAKPNNGGGITAIKKAMMESQSSNPRDIISVDVPLFIRLLEYAREDAKTDMDLHDVAENIITLSAGGKVLTMDDYSHIVGPSKSEIKEAEVGDVNIGSGIKSTVTNINPETGTVAWDIDYVPAYDTVFSDFTKLRKSIDQLAIKTKDSVVNDLTSNIKDLYNKYRTYLRKNQPDVYKKFGSVAEEGEGGMSVSNAAGGYLGKYAYRLPKKQKDLGEETEAPKPNAKDPGATLGAGPSASSKGVKNNAYVKQFGYKVVK